MSEHEHETPAERFDAERVAVGSWFTNLFKKAVKAAGSAGKAYLSMQAADGSQTNATPDAIKKAAEMIDKARGGDKEQQQKIEAVAALADRGDPAAKQATTLLSVVNDVAKIAEAKAGGKGAAQVGAADFDVERTAEELDVDGAYDWDW